MVRVSPKCFAKPKLNAPTDNHTDDAHIRADCKIVYAGGASPLDTSSRFGPLGGGTVLPGKSFHLGTHLPGHIVQLGQEFDSRIPRGLTIELLDHIRACNHQQRRFRLSVRRLGREHRRSPLCVLLQTGVKLNFLCVVAKDVKVVYKATVSFP